jgi:cyclic dehypoxanthinyl futalosine synthase
MTPSIDRILADTVAGERLSAADALVLLQSPHLASIGRAANAVTMRLHPEPYRTYNIDRNINYTNVCTAVCDFCAFYRPPKHAEGYVLDREVLMGKIAEMVSVGGDQILLQGGLHPTLELEWYEDLLRDIKARFPQVNVHREWHAVGGRSTATMMFGHVETLAERVEHLERIRELQDETGGLTAFICWSFQPDNTEMADIPPSGPFEYLKTQAVARLYLDNVPNIQSSWVTQGREIGQLALLFGANDMGSLMLEENVVSAAGTVHHLTLEQMRSAISELGWIPRRRNVFYELFEDDDAVTPVDRAREEARSVHLPVAASFQLAES